MASFVRFSGAKPLRASFTWSIVPVRSIASATAVPSTELKDDFNRGKANYREKSSMLRKQYHQEYLQKVAEANEQRRIAHEQFLREKEVRMAKLFAERKRLQDIRTREYKIFREGKDKVIEMRNESHASNLARASARRIEFIKRLNEDSSNWITQENIDEKITAAALFSPFPPLPQLAKEHLHELHGVIADITRTFRDWDLGDDEDDADGPWWDPRVDKLPPILTGLGAPTDKFAQIEPKVDEDDLKPSRAFLYLDKMDDDLGFPGLVDNSKLSRHINQAEVQENLNDRDGVINLEDEQVSTKLVSEADQLETEWRKNELKTDGVPVTLSGDAEPPMKPQPISRSKLSEETLAKLQNMTKQEVFAKLQDQEFVEQLWQEVADDVPVAQQRTGRRRRLPAEVVAMAREQERRTRDPIRLVVDHDSKKNRVHRQSLPKDNTDVY